MLFHTPWWAPGLLLIVGAFVFISGNRRQERNTRLAGLAIALLGITLACVSYLVDTPVEKTVKQSRQLVNAIEAREWTTVESLLDAKSSLSVFQAFTLYSTREQILAAAKKGVEQYGIKNVRVLRADAAETGAIITVTLDLMSEQDFTMGRPITSSWQFEWYKNGSAWTLRRIINLKIADRTGKGASAQFPKQ
jgi:hypothetical protein